MNDNKPRVSIGMPVYNGEKYLATAIESILAQTYRDFEFIISDNASTDNTAAICHSYVCHDQRIRYYRNDKNLGAAPNYNRVHELATGEYFKWADYDDILEPTFLERCVDALDHNPQAILCYPKAVIINEYGEYVADRDPAPDITSLGPHKRFREFIINFKTVIQLSGLMRSDSLKRTGGFGAYPAADEVLLAELSLYGEFCEVAERLLKLRLHPEQSTKGQWRQQRARVLFFDTSKEGKIVLAHWLFFQDCIRAVRWAPLTAYQRAYCYTQIVRKMLVPDHFRALGKDVLLAAAQLLARSYAKPNRQVTGV